MANYVALLRRDINDCAFTANCNCNSDVSNLFLRAQFIRGINDNSIREQLLQSDDSDFDKILQKALSLEAPKVNCRELQSKMPNDVHKIHSNFNGNSRRRNKSRNRTNSKSTFRSKSKINYAKLGIADLCIRCGRNNHKTQDCRTNPNKLKCRSCGKTGHVQQVCIKTLIKSTNNVAVYKNDSDEEYHPHQMYDINQIVDI